MALGAFGKGALTLPDPLRPVPLLGWYRTSHAGHQLATVAFFAGLAGLLTAWVRLGRHPVPVPRLWRIAGLWALPLLLAPPLASRDVYSYLAQGHLVRIGLDPYVVGPAAAPGPLLHAVSRTWWYTPAPYGPVFLWLSAGVNGLAGNSLLAGVALFRGVAVLSCAASALLLRQLCRRLDVDPAWPTWLVLLNPLLLLHLLSGAHSEALLLPLLLGAVLLSLPGRRAGTAAGAALVGVAAAVKVTAVVAVPFLALLRPRHRFRGLATAGLVSLAVLAGISAGSGYGLGWLRAIGPSTRHGSRLAITHQLGLWSRSAGRALGDPAAGRAVARVLPPLGVALAAVIVLALLGLCLFRADGPRQVLRRAGLAWLAVAALGPAVHPWYALPGLALLAAGDLGPVLRRLLVTGSLLVAVLLRPEGREVLDKHVPFAALCALVAFAAAVLLSRRRARPA